MKVTILNIYSNKKGLVNKDVSGRMGTRSYYGDSIISKILTYIKKIGVRYPILSYGYLAAIFKKDGHQIEVLDNEIPYNTDIVFIYSSIVDYKTEIEFAKKIKKNNKNAKIGFIGTFPSVMPEIFLENGDFVIKNEPEDALCRISKGKLQPEGVIESNPVENLDDLPFPYWNPFLNSSRFLYIPYFLFQKKNFFPILSSRGCFFPCGYYCPYPIVARKNWRYRSPDNVNDEIEYLIKDYNASLLLFRDPIFSFNRNRTFEIAQNLIKRKLKINYVCETHLSCLDKELIDILYASGLRAIKVGIESVDENVLEAVHRKSAEKKHQEMILQYCDKKGIAITGFYILGLPQDTKEIILKTIAYAKKLNTLGAQFTISTPYPGTRFYEDLDKKGLILTKDFEKYDIHTLVFKHSNLSCEELLNLKDYAYKTYYFRLSWMLKFLRLKVLKWF